MKHFQIANNKITFSLDYDSSRLSKAQRIVVERLCESNKHSELIEYISSFKGNRRANVYVSRPRVDYNFEDTLSQKSNGSILKLFESKFDYFDSKNIAASNIAKGIAVGVEIECLIPRIDTGEGEYDSCYNEHSGDCSDECCCALEFHPYIETESEVTSRIAEVFKDFKVKNTLIKGDGSLTENDSVQGIEIVTIIPANDFSNLMRICSALKKLNARIDKTCGLHIHIDSRAHRPSKLVKNLQAALPLLCSMVPVSRVKNHYCQIDVSSKKTSRYAKINTHSYKKHKTIEVRLHSGTTDFNKISQWITVLRSIALNDKALPVSKTYDVQFMADTLSWSEETMEYVAQRQLLFKDGHIASSNGQSVDANGEAIQAA